LAPDEALEVERRVYEDAERALAIDPTLGLAHAALAAVHQANWRGTAAEQAFQRSVELSPNDVHILVQYAEVKAARGERDEAIRLHRRALELDPNSWFVLFQFGATYRNFGEWDAAAATFQNVLNRYPADVRSNVSLAVVEAHRGNVTEAVRLLQVAEQLGPPLFHVVRMVQAYALAGRPEEARRMFTEFEQRAAAEGIGDAWWATAYVAVGDYEQALERLELAVNGRSPVDQTALIELARNTEGNPELDKPEFRALLDGLWDE
jgi:Tfp pilus assembly protein PilF